MEAEIEKLEENMEALSRQMENPDLASDFEKITALSEQINEQQLRLSDCYAQWEVTDRAAGCSDTGGGQGLKNTEAFETEIGYRFKNRELLKLAMTLCFAFLSK